MQEKTVQEFLQALDTMMGYINDCVTRTIAPMITPDQFYQTLKTAHKHALTLGLEEVATWIEEQIEEHERI